MPDSHADERRDLFADTWVASAALGRASPLGGQFRPPQSDKFGGDIKSFWVDGDSAPNGRFHYRYKTRRQRPENKALIATVNRIMDLGRKSAKRCLKSGFFGYN